MQPRNLQPMSMPSNATCFARWSLETTCCREARLHHDTRKVWIMDPPRQAAKSSTPDTTIHRLLSSSPPAGGLNYLRHQLCIADSSRGGFSRDEQCGVRLRKTRRRSQGGEGEKLAASLQTSAVTDLKGVQDLPTPWHQQLEFRCNCSPCTAPARRRTGEEPHLPPVTRRQPPPSPTVAQSHLPPAYHASTPSP